MPTFKELLRTDELIRVFLFGRVFHPIVIEMFGLAGGYHGFWVDGEHVGLTTQQLTVAGLAARANGFDCFARIPPVGYWYVTQCLEAGMGGVMAAQIHTAAQAEEFVRWAKFAPRGGRGLNLGGRDADYTHKPAARFVAEANRDQFVAIQIETAGAVDQAEEIAALDGVDLLFIGPADLSLALGRRRPVPASAILGSHRPCRRLRPQPRESVGGLGPGPAVRRAGHRGRLPPGHVGRRPAGCAPRCRSPQGGFRELLSRPPESDVLSNRGS